MSEQYALEDERMASCTHPSSVILYLRLCNECGKTLEDRVIEPGTETIIHAVTLEVKP